MNAAYDLNASVVRASVDAFNRRELDDWLAYLAPDVELRTFRGVKRGRRAAAEWFRKPLDHLDLELEVADLVLMGDRVVSTCVVRFRWKETGELAEEVVRPFVWTIEGGQVRSLEPFEGAEEALRAAGVLPRAA